MANATSAWEEALLISKHRLDRTLRSLDPNVFENNPEWERHHRNCHTLLVGNCASRPLVGFCEQLADRLHRYRALSSRGSFRVRKVTEEHSALLKAVVDRKPDEAAKLLKAHYERTTAFIVEDLAIPQQPA
jgi:DNA-binding GntR family transcriptional regulator